ncbi:transporter substrate-binding domain-containing protein [Rheinheimera riviphila]|uniref:Transporter substrate-binding domain-containing protein n=1 Tax=Rheinheimera riviphila TaxID=1834037 RepID=A0A437R1F2_9GAMM|nr:transporter substrate-binding domain-containing protein [Rheinheimera riviphila]RVU40560.1 transporter substrate-binding domain-containing protein [Rheinheimera riviphila]
MKLWRVLMTWFVVGCMFFSAGFVALAADPQLPPTKLKIAISNDTYPYTYLDKQEQPGGLVVDWWRTLAKAQNIEIEFQAVDWANIMELLDSGQVDIIGGMAVTAERQQKYLMGSLVTDVHSNVFLHRDLVHVNTLAQLAPHIVGVVKNSGNIAAINSKQPGLTLKTYENTTAMYDAALAGQIKAFVTMDRLTPRYPEFERLNQLYPVFKKLPLHKLELTYGLRKSDEQLASKLAQWAKQLPADLTDKLQRRWLSGASTDDSLLLSLSVGNQPLMGVSPSGQPQGLLVDLWTLWSEKTATPIAIVPDISSSGIKSLSQGRVDIHMGYPLQPSSGTDLQSAYQVYNFSSSFYYPKNMPVSSLADVKLPVGIFTSAGYYQQLRNDFPNLVLQQVNTLDEMLFAVERRQIAGFFGSDLVMQHRLLLTQSDTYKALDYPRFNSPLYALVREGNTMLANKIAQGFAALTQDQLEAVEKRWINQSDFAYFAKFRQQVPLTTAEKDWLSQHPQLKVGVLADWAPMEFIDENGQFSGVTQDVLHKLNQRLGTNFVAVPFQHWDDLQQAFRDGQLDVVANMSDLPERRKYAAFSINFWPLQWTLISHNSTAEISQLKQLQGKKIAVLKEYQIAKYFELNFPTIALLHVESLDEGLKALQRGEADFVVDTVVSSGRALRQTENRNLRMHLPTDMPTYPSLFAVRKDWPELLKILDKGLKTLTEADRSEILDRWFTVEIRQGVDEGKVADLILQIVGIGVFLLALVFFWNMSLRREIGLRRDMEQKMRFMATHDDLTKLANRNLLEERLTQALHQHARHHEKLALLFLDLDGFKEVNDRFGHHVGDELLIKVADVLNHCVRKSDTVARFGGDEFVILLTAMLDKDDAAIVAEKILLHLSTPLQLSACSAQVGASIGIALYPDNGTDSQQMMKAADSLMYQAKQQGKGCYRFSQGATSAL